MGNNSPYFIHQGKNVTIKNTDRTRAPAEDMLHAFKSFLSRFISFYFFSSECIYLLSSIYFIKTNNNRNKHELIRP